MSTKDACAVEALWKSPWKFARLLARLSVAAMASLRSAAMAEKD